MKNYKNNFRKNRYRNNGDRSFKRSDNIQKIDADFSNSSNFQRRNPGRNNHNAPKLIEKYTDLAREALSKGDKILSENYFQHADHFTRIIEEQEKKRSIKNLENSKNNEIKTSNLEEDQEAKKKNISS